MQQSFFSCLGTIDSQTVVFLAELSYSFGAVDMPSLLTSWVTATPYVIVDSTQLQMDPTCPVVIDSLQPESCPVASVLPPTDQSAVSTADPSSNPATDSPTDVTVIVIVVAVAVVVLLVMVMAIVAIVIAVIVFGRKQSKCRYVPIFRTNTSYISSWLAFKVCIPRHNKFFINFSTSHRFLFCRPNSSPANSVYEDESMNKGDLARADMTKNPSYTVTRDVVSTSHTLGTEEEEDEVDHTYEVLPFEAYEECQEDTKHGAQKATTVDAQ